MGVIKDAFTETGIPKIFWYVVSFSILVVTSGLMWVFFKSSNVSIEVANTKIQMIRGISDIETAFEALKAKEDELQKVAAKVPTPPTTIPMAPVARPTPPKVIDDKLHQNILRLGDIRTQMQQQKF